MLEGSEQTFDPELHAGRDHANLRDDLLALNDKGVVATDAEIGLAG